MKPDDLITTRKYIKNHYVFYNGYVIPSVWNSKDHFTEIEWAATPAAVRQYIEMLEKSILHLTETIADFKGRTEKLEHRVNRNSQISLNSSKLKAPSFRTQL